MPRKKAEDFKDIPGSRRGSRNRNLKRDNLSDVTMSKEAASVIKEARKASEYSRRKMLTKRKRERNGFIWDLERNPVVTFKEVQDTMKKIYQTVMEDIQRRKLVLGENSHEYIHYTNMVEYAKVFVEIAKTVDMILQQKEVNIVLLSKYVYLMKFMVT
jgi:hypothetical protein